MYLMVATASHTKRNCFQPDKVISYHFYHQFFFWGEECMTKLVVSAGATIGGLQLRFMFESDSCYSGQADCPVFFHIIKQCCSTCICIFNMVNDVDHNRLMRGSTGRRDCVVKAEPHDFLRQFPWQSECRR